MRAQKRLRDNNNAARMKEEKDLDNILVRTAELDSAVRAVNLHKLLSRKWYEEKNAYIIMSKITEKQQTKLQRYIE